MSMFDSIRRLVTDPPPGYVFERSRPPALPGVPRRQHPKIPASARSTKVCSPFFSVDRQRQGPGSTFSEQVRLMRFPT